MTVAAERARLAGVVVELIGERLAIGLREHRLREHNHDAENRAALHTLVESGDVEFYGAEDEAGQAIFLSVHTWVPTLDEAGQDALAIFQSRAGSRVWDGKKWRTGKNGR